MTLMRTKNAVVVKSVDWATIAQNLLQLPLSLFPKICLEISGFKRYLSLNLLLEPLAAKGAVFRSIALRYFTSVEATDISLLCKLTQRLELDDSQTLAREWNSQPSAHRFETGFSVSRLA